MTAVATPETERRSVLDCPGGPPVGASFAFRGAQRRAVGELITQLRRVCGSIVIGTGGHGVGYLATSESQWRSLRDCSPVEVVGAIRRASRDFPDLAIPGTDGQSIHVRLEYLFRRTGSQ